METNTSGTQSSEKINFFSLGLGIVASIATIWMAGYFFTKGAQAAGK